MRSIDYEGEVRFAFNNVPPRQAGDWGNYLRGAVCALQQHYDLDTGLVGLTQGSVSEGGLSSSASVGVAYLLALQLVNSLRVTPRQDILLDQFIENEYLGLRNGILDQSAILLSRKGHLTWIDCARVEHAVIPPAESMSPFAILIAFSGLRKSLVTTDYNRRVAECSEAARILLDAGGRRDALPVLGNVTADQYERLGHLLSGAAKRRAAHFFSEMERVRRGVEAWRQGELDRFGDHITQSGASSIRHYECGCPPLIDLYETLIGMDGVYGARFSGAGFRGCCLALVEPDKVDQVAERTKEVYARQHPDLARHAWTLPCQSGDGARCYTRE